MIEDLQENLSKLEMGRGARVHRRQYKAGWVSDKGDISEKMVSLKWRGTNVTRTTAKYEEIEDIISNPVYPTTT